MALTDYFNNATISTRPDAGALTAQKLLAATSITVDTTAGWPTSPDSVHFIIYQVDASGNKVAGTQTDWKGTVTSATAIGSLTLKAGTDQIYPVGSKVICAPTGAWADDLITGMLVSHDNDGTMIDSLPLTTPKITTSINDSAGNEVIKTPATASAVNEITVTNAATGNAPSISATGGDSAVHLNLRGKGLAKTVTIGAGATTIFPYDYVVSGCVWSGDAYASTRNASMTAGVVVINGNPVTVAAVTARSFTASKDVYVDVLDNGDGTGLLVYTDGTTNAASPALASNSIRIAIIVVGATNIAAATSVNQGQKNKLLPIASSIPYAVSDSLGNRICLRSPSNTLRSYREVTSASPTSTSATASAITGLTVVGKIPAYRQYKATLFTGELSNNTANQYAQISICNGSASDANRLAYATVRQGIASMPVPATVVYYGENDTSSEVTVTLVGGLSIAGGTGTATALAGAASPLFISLELL